MNTNLESAVFAQYFGEIAVAILVIAFLLRKFLISWKANDTESYIIKVMRDELMRMSTQNTALSVELGRLNDEVIKLHNQLQKLSVENQRLQEEVVVLTGEITKLEATLTRGDMHGSAS
jgi:hypothetical protein